MSEYTWIVYFNVGSSSSKVSGNDDSSFYIQSFFKGLEVFIMIIKLSDLIFILLRNVFDKLFGFFYCLEYNQDHSIL
jgi:hypothetical protein